MQDLFLFFCIFFSGSYKGLVSDHRSKDQTLIAVPISKAFLAEVDAVRGDQSRSAFVRAALYEKVKNMTGGLNPEISYAPSRTGKGGKPTHKDKAVEPTLVAAAEVTEYKVAKSKQKKVQ